MSPVDPGARCRGPWGLGPRIIPPRISMYYYFYSVACPAAYRL